MPQRNNLEKKNQISKRGYQLVSKLCDIKKEYNLHKIQNQNDPRNHDATGSLQIVDDTILSF
jgi:hypothetical protein